MSYYLFGNTLSDFTENYTEKSIYQKLKWYENNEIMLYALYIII